MPTSPRSFRTQSRSAIRTCLDYARAGLMYPRLFTEAARFVLHGRARRRASLRRAASQLAAAPLPKLAEAGDFDPRQLAEALSARMGVLLLSQNGRAVTIGLADTDLVVALRMLGRAAPAARFGADGLEFDTEDPAGQSRALAARQLTFAPSEVPIGASEAGPDGYPVLTIECYALRRDGVWVSNNKANDVSRALYEDLLARPGLYPLSRILPGPTLKQQSELQPVDLVYTWVNHADPAWAALFAKHRDAALNRRHEAEAVSGDAVSLARFHSVDELKYSLRSVARNMPWVRRIHILSNCDRPDWLLPDHPRIRWVRHEEVIAPEYLPTFSSHAIESHLHLIPGLSERFVYLNDDFFVAAPLQKSFFFDENGASHAFLEPGGMVSGPVREEDPDYLNAARNGAALLFEAFGTSATRLHEHTAFALRRDVLAEIEARWPQAYHRMRQNRFRASTDLSPTSFLYHHYALNTGRARIMPIALSLITPFDIRWRNRLRHALQPGVQTICINEGGTEPPSPDWHEGVRGFLETAFPEPAEWERQG
ncbi:stealth conserved region 3 domain-containing protein (plasmid) [Limimaricola variabilis]|uniref:stealth conserved region 3 domain-containing protein n=1 Tax=Limimaricola variabilis TaxID=1492771 RepID=UPI002AC9157A|nr:stealth conserved region 3 domain-containing protein [Limimaricola variabilis]WPY97048.1 stealth conserved region 3 domain-containing protein [Limimaricola variabilis]